MNSGSEDMEIEEAWQIGCNSLIPIKSKQRYEKTYAIFKNWINEKNAVITEKTMLAYFVQRNQNTLKSPGSLWAEYSMLKTTINLNDNINISQFTKLIAFLKKKNVGHQPKKSKVFTREQMNRFLMEAPDTNYLMMKVVMIMGIAGACRREELENMTIDNIQDKGEVVIVNVPNTKTNVPRNFTITDKIDQDVNFLEILRKYFLLRPQNAGSRGLFYALRNGKCVNQVVGLNTIGQVPLKIAEYLNLDNPTTYTGHAFRRTSATLLADTGVDIIGLKRHGGWKSSTVAEGYIEDSLQNKIKFANRILHSGHSTITSSSSSTMPDIVEDVQYASTDVPTSVLNNSNSINLGRNETV